MVKSLKQWVIRIIGCFYDNNIIICLLNITHNEKLIWKNWEGAEFFLVHTAVKLSWVPGNEKLE